MSAQQNHTVFTAYLSDSSGTVTVGKVLCLNAGATRYVISTTANRALQTLGSVGVAITAGDQDTPAVEIQFCGMCPESITGLGAGAANPVRVSSTGTLERVASPTTDDEVVGKCDTLGNALLNFATPQEISSSLATGPPDKSLQYRVDAATLGGDAYWTREDAGWLSVAVDQIAPKGHGFITVIAGNGSETPATADLPSIGFIRLSDLVADNGGFNSQTVVSYFSSTAGGVQVAAMGVTGGSAFLGDPSFLALTHVYGDGVDIDAGPGGGPHPNSGNILLQGPLLVGRFSTIASFGSIRLGDGGVDGSDQPSIVSGNSIGGGSSFYMLSAFTTSFGDNGGPTKGVVLGSGGSGASVDPTNTADTVYAYFNKDAVWAWSRLTPEAVQVGVDYFEWDQAGPIGGFDHRRAVLFQRHTNLILLGVNDSVSGNNPDALLGSGEGVVGLGFAEVNPTTSTTGGLACYADAADSQLKYRLPDNDHEVLGHNLLSYTFPSDGNQTLSAADSESDMIVIASGTISVARNLISARLAKRRRRITIRNDNAQTVNFGWASGGTVAVTTGKTATIACDGTNAVLMSLV